MKDYFDTFISYGRADSKAFATRLHEKLTQKNLKVWFDQNDIPLAVDFQKQIDEGIEKSHTFIFIIAPHSVNSCYCLKEIELAIKYKKRIIPLLHVEQISQEIWLERNPNGSDEEWKDYQAKGLHSSQVNMHPVISKLNWVSFREEIDDCQANLEKLINLLQQDTDYIKQHTHFLVQARQWEKSQKQTRYLLIGSERIEAEKWLKTEFKNQQPPCEPTDLHCEFICESIKNAKNLMSEVFISYGTEDKLIMLKLRKTLMRHCITVWTNHTDIQSGLDFEQQIKQGIEQSDNVIYLISLNALFSQYCQMEFNYALAYNKRIIPLLISSIDLHKIPPQLSALQFIDLTDSENEEKYNYNIDQLIKVIKEDSRYYETHKLFLIQAIKWERQNHNPSLLLRGSNLSHAQAWLKVGKTKSQHQPTPLQEEFITASLQHPPLGCLDVFISYSRSDSDFARQLNEALQEIGKTTWFDQESIACGADFQEEIYRGIELCDNFVFIISPKSVNSPYCADEVEYAQKLNKRFVTILHRPLSVEDKQKQPPTLVNMQYIDFNQQGRDFAANFYELVRTLDTDRDHVRNHTEWSQKALKWKNKHQEEALLLRGSEFAVAEAWLKTAEAENKKPIPTKLHKEFITQSRKALEARKENDKRQIFILRSLLTGSFILLLATIGASSFAFLKLKEAQINRADSLGRYSLSLFKEHKELEAFIEAIRAAKILHNRQVTNSTVINALQLNLAQRRERNRLEGHNNYVTKVSFSSDGKMIASGSDDKTIKLWNVQTGQQIRTLRGHDQSVLSLSFSPNGKMIASASRDKIIKLWNVQTGQPIRTLRGHDGYVYSVSFSPDGKMIASSSRDKTIKLWNVQTGQQIRALRGHDGYVYSVSFSPDGKTLASGSSDKTIKLWNVQTGQPIRTLRGHNGYVYSLSFSLDGKRLASGSADKTIKIWNVSKETEILTFNGHRGYVYSVSYSPDGKTLASGSDDKTIKLWDVITGTEMLTLYGHPNYVRSVSYSPDGKTLASSSEDKTIKLWDVSTQTEIRIFRGHSGYVYSISLSNDGKTLASGSGDKTIKLWDVSTGIEIRTLKGHDDYVRSVTFSPDGKTLASSSNDLTIKLWDVSTGKEIRTLKEHHGWVRSVSFSPDGKMIASGSDDLTIKLWDVKTGKEIRTLNGHHDYVRSVSFSPDGKMIASSSDDLTIKLWDVKTGKEIRTLNGHHDYVRNVRFSPDGKTLASGSNDLTIKLWDVKTGKEIYTLNGHDGYVRRVSWSKDGKRLASGSADKTIKIWDLSTKTELFTLKGYDESVRSVTFSPDGKTLISGSDDSTIKLWYLDFWTLDLHALMGRSCDWVRNYLKNNPNVKTEDRNLCDGIGTQK